MSENQPEKGQLLSRTCHQHLQTRLGISFNKDKIAQQQSGIEGKDAAIPMEVPCCTSQPVSHMKRRLTLSKKLFFVVSCITIHKKEFTSSLKKERTLRDSLLDSEVQPTSRRHLA